MLQPKAQMCTKIVEGTLALYLYATRDIDQPCKVHVSGPFAWSSEAKTAYDYVLCTLIEYTN